MLPVSKPLSFKVLDTPRKLTFRQLCGRWGGATPIPDTEVFFDFGSNRPVPFPEAEGLIRESQYSYPGRLSWHDDFLREHGKQIKSFADIGCALPLGAPTTVDARGTLPRESKVIAVDVAGDFKNPNLKRAGIETLEHSIVEGPLREKVDAIRLVNVTRYLDQSQRRRALANIFKSLNEGGRLFGKRRVYRKSGRGFEVIAKKALEGL
jgi:SAM-dependent methyltransferase